MNDREKYLAQARTYIGKDGDDVCNDKLGLGYVVDWCAYAVTCIMRDCGFIGKYVKEIEGGAGTIPRNSDGKYGTWFRKGEKKPQSSDLIFFRYGGSYTDKYHADHVGTVEAVDGDELTTLEGNVDGWGSDWAGTSTFKRKTRYLSSDTVYAFYRPFWQDSVKPDSKPAGTQTGVSTKPKSQPSEQISQLYSSQVVNFDVTVTADDGVNIRSGAGTVYKILGAVPCGSTVHISRMTSDTKYSWGLTEYDGVKGWIALNFTQKCARKTVDQLAQEVINGDWDVGDERERLLQQAGYDYQAVQKRVNEILK